MASESTSTSLAILFIATNVILALLAFQSPRVATVHALLTVCAGLWIAMRARPAAVASAGAYIIGAEVLWRMAGANIFWEFGKYALTLVLLVALLRMGRKATWKVLPLLYFSLLLPSVTIVLSKPALTSNDTRQALSHALSGPLALAVSVFFLAQVRLNNRELRNLLMAAIAPIAGIAFVTLVSTYSATTIQFTTESNFITSGGFGPNEVSAVLGLGVLFSCMLWSDAAAPRGIRMLALGLTALLIAQCVMTFSRGGIYGAGGALIVYVALLWRERRNRAPLILSCAVLSIALASAVLPRLNAFTGGDLEARFSSANTTHRGALMLEDLQIWTENPVLGVGPGQVKKFHDQVGTSDHTEFTRLLAEHGCFGLVALCLMLVMSLTAMSRRQSIQRHALSASWIVWALLTMVHAAMRIAAPSFVFGLAFVRENLTPQDD